MFLACFCVPDVMGPIIKKFKDHSFDNLLFFPVWQDAANPGPVSMEIVQLGRLHSLKTLALDFAELADMHRWPDITS